MSALDEAFGRSWDDTLSRLGGMLALHPDVLEEVRRLCLIAFIQGSTFGGEERHEQGMRARQEFQERLLARCSRAMQEAPGGYVGCASTS